MKKKMEIVKLGDKYFIREGTKYFQKGDVHSDPYWWTAEYRDKYATKFSDLAEATDAYLILNRKEEVVYSPKSWWEFWK